MRQIVRDYEIVTPLEASALAPMGASASPKGMLFHILEDNSGPVDVLDIGFGVGDLGKMVRANPDTRHWSVDGVDGFAANCHNPELVALGVYRNIWHGLAQELPSDRLAAYRMICLLDVIEHLTAHTARWLLRTLLAAMGPQSYLFISTPLWFYPQDMQQTGDLEEHLIGVPATSMMALMPKMYAVNHPLVGGFVYDKASLDYVEFFQPTADKSFSFDKGMAVANVIGLQTKPGVVYKVR